MRQLFVIIQSYNNLHGPCIPHWRVTYDTHFENPLLNITEKFYDVMYEFCEIGTTAFGVSQLTDQRIRKEQCAIKHANTSKLLAQMNTHPWNIDRNVKSCYK
ncbi:hypothetical protein L798_09702 [Zootermopsis nevadensis]|uniref:Uncharacterized protein n=1 Tax=Zootermopsis nevadensis TaxID=136037 RepID=A0A067R0F8_ZOONE|nr:hypothetical protein L798_09702 [Zootermopsis nevadensis]